MAAPRAAESVRPDTFSLPDVQWLLRSLSLSLANDAMNDRGDMSGLLRAAGVAFKLSDNPDEIRDVVRYGARS